MPLKQYLKRMITFGALSVNQTVLVKKNVSAIWLNSHYFVVSVSLQSLQLQLEETNRVLYKIGLFMFINKFLLGDHVRVLKRLFHPWSRRDWNGIE